MDNLCQLYEVDLACIYFKVLIYSILSLLEGIYFKQSDARNSLPAYQM